MPENDYHLQPTKVDIPDELLHVQSVLADKAGHDGPLSDTRGAADVAPGSVSGGRSLDNPVG